jgi:hypothetical protein
MTAIPRIRRTLQRCAQFALLPQFVLAKAAEDIRDIRGPKAALAWPWWATALLAGALAVALYAAFVIFRRRRGRARGRDLSWSEQALQRLEHAKLLMQPATARDFGIAASEVIRSYIEKRFDVTATQRTTEEFLQTLLHSSNEPLARHRQLLAQFLEQCDFVKFAGAAPAGADLEALFRSARSFVLETSQPVAA